MPKDEDNFTVGKVDLGTQPALYPLTDDQKKLASVAMAVNATLVTLIAEGIFPIDHQVHFMGHFQDFMDRIYNGEGVKLDNVNQTLQVNAKTGNLFFEATNNAFYNGSKNFADLKEVSKEMVRRMNAENGASPTIVGEPVSKPTLH